MKGKTNNIFFDSKEKTYSDVLAEVQKHIATQYSGLITNQDSDAKQQIKRYIGAYVQNRHIAVEGIEDVTLVDMLYSEMAEYGFLTKYIFGTGIEEIDINSWDDVEVQYSNGSSVKIDEHFDSPEHAINVVRRMLHASGSVMDDGSPVVTGTLSANIRIAVIKTPIVDADVGVAASIRIVNPQSMTRDDFVSSGMATADMLDSLADFLRHGISICVAGPTSSGKTTVMGWVLTTIPDNKRVFTIEAGSRELSLVRRTNGKVTNSVIHTLTRPSEDDRQNIDQITLLDIMLRLNPDIVGVGEMRGPEANAGQEIARAGVGVITTTHSNSCISTYSRMVSLCKRAVDMSDATLRDYVTEAYPIIVYCKQLENKQRRMMEIMECEITPDGERHYRTLYQYVITENVIVDGDIIIKGSHIKKNCISSGLEKRLIENGMPQNKVEKMKEMKSYDND